MTDEWINDNSDSARNAFIGIIAGAFLIGLFTGLLLGKIL